MLVLTRNRGEEIIIRVKPSHVEQVIRITPVNVRGDKVRIGIDATGEVRIDRKEIDEKRQAEKGARDALRDPGFEGN